MDCLRKIDDINKTGPLPPLLCTMDVSALYTNIQHEEGTVACRSRSTSPLFMTKHTYRLTALLWVHAWTLNTANIVMGAMERRLLCSFPDKPLVWLRYMYDIFLIWTHGRAKLEAFIQHANTFHPTFKFTFKISTTNIPFLDVIVTLPGNSLLTDLYI